LIDIPANSVKRQFPVIADHNACTADDKDDDVKAVAK
jgi:hypothetical protein